MQNVGIGRQVNVWDAGSAMMLKALGAEVIEIQTRNRWPKMKDVEALIIKELRRLHTGILASYRLPLSELVAWQSHQEG